MERKALFFMLLLITTLTSCEIVKGIFNVGVGVGILIVVVVLGLILWLVSRFRK